MESPHLLPQKTYLAIGHEKVMPTRVSISGQWQIEFDSKALQWPFPVPPLHDCNKKHDWKAENRPCSNSLNLDA
jgi:hypothetical protein